MKKDGPNISKPKPPTPNSQPTPSSARILDEICKALGSKVHEHARDTVTLSTQHHSYPPVQLDDLDAIATQLQDHPLEGMTRYTGYGIEILVSPEHEPFRLIDRLQTPLTLTSPESNLVYELGAPSLEFAIGILLKISPKTNSRALRYLSPHYLRLKRARAQVDPDQDAFTDLVDLFRRFRAIKISAPEEKSRKALLDHSNSFLFHLAFNADIALSHVDEAFFSGQVRLARRGRGLDEIEAPLLSYDHELVSRYLSALATNDPVSSYLSYYHVLEGQFHEVFNEHLITTLRKELTSPGFSTRRDDDILRLSKQVTKLIKERSNETQSFDERSALRLTLTRHVDLSGLKSRLPSDDYIASLGRSGVSFSGGSAVDLHNEGEAVIQDLTNRVYDTRNSVVHAKSSETARYRPSVDSAALSHEVPLMRALAEEIIVSKSKRLPE